MNTKQHNWTEEEEKLNQESIIQRATRQSVCEVLNQLIQHLNLMYHEGMESLAVSNTRERRSLQWKHLNWRFPGKAEYRCVTTTIKQQEVLLKHMYRQGKDTFLHELLIRLLRNLWKYIQMSNFNRMGSLSMHHEGERMLFPSQAERGEPDTLLQHLKTLVYLFNEAMPGRNTQESMYDEEGIPFLLQIEGHERDTLQQHVKKLLHLLKIAMPGCSPQGSHRTRGNEDNIFQECGSCYAHQEL